MAIIYTYPDLGAVDGTEKLLVSDGSDENNAKTVTTAAYGAYINATYGGGGGSSIYQADGSITANRQLSGSSLYSLTLANLTTFTVNTSTNIALNPTTTVDVGEGKGITTANTTGTVEAIKDKNVANNYIKWLSRSLGVNGDDLILSGAYGVSLRANDTIAGVNLTSGTSGKLTITNGVPTLNGSNNSIADITSAASKALITKEWAIDYIANWAGSTNITTLGTIATGTWNATEISTLKGGTGLTSYSTGNILYASAPNVLGKLTLGTTGHVLVAGASVPAWQALTVNNSNWSGTALSSANGGTGQTTYAQGDILYANASGVLAKLSPGTTNHVLTTKGAGVDPVWQAAPGGTSVTGTAPVVSTGTTPVVISMAQANGSTDGYLRSTDWTTFNNKGDGVVTTLTTTGSGAATLVGATLNIPTPTGDMLAATYDPTSVAADAFDYTNQIGLTQMPTSQIREYTESGGGSVDFNDYDPTTYNVHFIDPGVHDRDFTGVVAPSAGVNRIVVIINYGTNKKLKFKHNDSGSAAANRIMLADDSDFDLNKGASIQLIYNHTENRWYTYTYY